MRNPENRRESGASLLMLLLPMSFVLALAGAVSTLTANGMRSTSRSVAQMESFYAADAGAQIANALLRSSGANAAGQTFETSIDGHGVTVLIEEIEPDVYLVTSSSMVSGESSTVELFVVFTPGNPFTMQAGFEIALGDGAELEDDLHVSLRNNTKVSGMDHDADGQELADQANAVPALGMPEVAGHTLETTLKNNAELVGVPQAVVNDLAGQADLLRDVRDEARESATIYLSGSTTLSQSNGQYGTPDDPAVVYANLGEENTLTLSGNFSGYGTLVINAEEAEESAVLRMGNNASWHGLIAIIVHDEIEDEGGALVDMKNYSSVTGTLAFLFDGEEIEDDPTLLSMENHSKILYSSETLGVAGADFEATAGEASTVMSFRK